MNDEQPGTPYASVTRQAAAIVAAAVGAVVFVGWAIDAPRLKSLHPDWVTMKPNTAIGFMLAGAALWRPWSRAGRVLSALAALVGAATLVEYAAGVDLGIDNLLFREPAGAVATPFAGRMAPTTALGLMLIGSALLLAEARPRLSQTLAAIVLLFGFLAIVGYAYGVETLYGIESTTAMALHTALTLLALGAGAMAARPDRGLVALLADGGPGGQAARRVLPAALLGPPILGAIVPASRFGAALFAVLTALVFVTLAAAVADRLRRHDASRLAAGELHARLAAVVESSQDAIVGVGLDGTILHWNRGARTLYGYDAAEARGQPAALLLPPSRAGEFRALIDRIRRGERVDRLDTEHVGRDGTAIGVALTVSPVLDGDGRVTGASCIARDVTELRQAAAELARSNAALEEFAYIASHDLQEPLRKVASFTELLERRYRGRLDADADRFIRHVVDGAHRMQALIDGLLTYSRVQRASMPVDATRLTDRAQEALALLSGAVERSGAGVTVEPLPEAVADPIQMTQLFQNLIGNAIKFVGREPPRVRVWAEAWPGEWTFAVADNGIGVAPEHLERIFGMFQRLHSRDAYPGTGLGLALCKRIVERHGGRIWAESTPGAGTTIRFTLPAEAVPAAEVTLKGEAR